MISFLPDVAKLNKSKGRVKTLPPPINNVKMYWLQETKKANKPPTIIPGRIAGKVIYQKVFIGHAPKLLA